MTSLRCAQLRIYIKLLAGTEARWRHFAIFRAWAGQQLHRFHTCFHPAFASNLIPHAECPSEFYTRAIETIRKICDANQIVVPNVLKARSVYEKLQTAKFSVPVVVSKYPQINFTQAFNRLNDGFVSPRARDLEWRILHQVVPVNAYLFRIHAMNRQMTQKMRN